MGTNFYWHEKPCECCKREFEPIHIGKSSGGWCFLLHVEPEKGINTLADWKAKFDAPDSVIKDEYGDYVPPHRMMERITDRQGMIGAKDWTPEQYRQNSAEPGPKGLARHAVNGRHCIGHGEGTWDYIAGEFS